MISPSRIIRFATSVVCALALLACTEEAPKSAGIKPGAKPAAKGSAADLNKPLVDRVRLALARDREIQADDIDVSADNGVVSLWGRVGSSKERRRAAETAAAVEGVKRVENKLTSAN
jgi:hyperosmotically inducible periplasmic protein